MKNNVSVIVFDLGNVLLPLNYDKLLTKLDSYQNSLGTKFAGLYKANYHLHISLESGQISSEKFLDIMMDWTENLISREKFCEIFSDIFYEDTEVTSLLPKLKKNYRLILLSNTNHIHKKFGWENYGFISHFEKLILSHEIGVMKPDIKIYQALEKYTDLPPEEHLFIDDLEENILTAKNMGWEGIIFSGYENLIKKLKERKILFN